MTNFATSLKNEIRKGLPGTDVQWQMASSDRLAKKIPLFPGKDARLAAVLIHMYPDDKAVHTVFMQRPDYVGIHGGQISFPGGKKELHDESIIQTALRESQEETGTDPSKILVLGTLTPLFISVSNMLVTPVVGWSDERPVFKHKPDEVSYLINADLKRLLDPSIIKTKPFEIRGEIMEIKYFDYDGNTIWGATAMILNEMLSIIRRGDLYLPV